MEINFKRILDNYCYVLETFFTRYERKITTLDETRYLIAGASRMFFVSMDDCIYKDIEDTLKTKDENRNVVVHYRGYDINVDIDDYGQQFTFKFNGKEYGLGSYNTLYLCDLITIVDEEINELKLIEIKKNLDNKQK